MPNVSRPTLKQHLSFFSTNCRRIVERYGDEAAKLLFRPAQCQGHRLDNYGINLHLPCISAELCLDNQAATSLNQSLAQLVCKLTVNQKDNLKAGLLRVPVKKLQLRKRLPWKVGDTSLLGELANKTLKGETEAVDSDPRAESAQASPPLFLLSCHVCGHTRNCSSTRLLRKG